MSRTGPRQASGYRGHVALMAVRALRDAAVGRLQARETAEGCGYADGPAAVTARCDAAHAPGNERRRPARRSSRRSLGVPRVPRSAVQLGARLVQPCELAHGRLSEEHRAPRTKPAHHRAVVLVDEVGERYRRLGGRPPGSSGAELHGHRDPAERELHVDVLRDRQGCIRVEMAHGVQPGLLDCRQRRLQFFDGRAFAGAKGVDERHGVARPRFIGHRPSVAPVPISDAPPLAGRVASRSTPSTPEARDE